MSWIKCVSRCFLFLVIFVLAFFVVQSTVNAQQYRCRVNENGNCVPCAPTNDINTCITTNFQCLGSTFEANLTCSFFDANTCPDTSQEFDRPENLFTCAGSATPTPPTSQYPPDAIPRPYVDCEDIEDDEFHSLRPYQASPCNQNIQDTALYCSNAIIVNDTFETDESANVGCVDDPTEGVRLCDFDVSRSVGVLVDLRNAELPIAGNTEEVTNSTNSRDAYNSREQIDDAQKLNEYISWYLNGRNGRAEYPYLQDDKNEAKDPNSGISDRRYIIDYSGPLKRLLPLRIQQKERVQEIENAYASVNQNANIRHNQIVGCTGVTRIPVFIGFVQYPDIQIETPIPCNRQNFWQSLFTTEVDQRLVGDDGSSGWYEDQNRPPVEEDYIGRPFIDYWEAYQEWRGKACGQLNLPGVPNLLLCINPPGRNPFGVLDYVAELFPYIPFSSTEDRVGDFRVEQNPPPQAQGSDPADRGPIVVANSRMAGSLYEELYFPHMQENEELSDLLQQTYVPQGVARNGPPDLSIFTAGQYCEVRQARVNPGDDLFGQQLNTTLTYDAQFQCEFVLDPEDAPDGGDCWEEFEETNTESCGPGEPGCVCDPANPTVCTRETSDSDAQCFPQGYGGCGNRDQLDCPSGYVCSDSCDEPDVNECLVTTTHSIPTYTETPFADSIWAKLVSGPMSAFKRFFPKFGLGTPITQLQDIPAVTNSSYSTQSPNAQVFAGTPQGQRPGSQAEIFFPHLGGIHKYFLQCVQDLIRPQGFGPNCMSDDLFGSDPTSTFGTAIQISTNDRRHVYPWLAVDPSGGPHIVYVRYNQDDSGPEELMYSNGSSPQSIGIPLSSVDTGPPAGIASGSDGVVHLVYHQSFDENRVYYRRLTNGTWSSPEVVSTNEGSRDPRVAVDEQGNAHIVWIQRNGDIYNVAYRIRRADGSMSNIISVNPSNRQQAGIAIAVSSDGAAHVAYQQVDGPWEIYHTRIDTNGNRSTHNVSLTSGNSRNPSIATSGNTILVVWGEGYSPQNHDILMKTSTDNGASWSAQINVSNNPALSDYPSITANSSGRAYIVWSDDPITLSLDTEIWFAEYSVSNQSVSAPAQISNLDNNQPSILPVIATGGGTVGVTWQDRTTGTWQIYYLGGNSLSVQSSSFIIPNSASTKFPQTEAFSSLVGVSGNPLRNASLWEKADSATSFNSPTVLGSAPGDASYTSVGLDTGNAGSFYSVWAKSDNAPFGVYLRRKSASGLDTQYTVVESNTFISNARLAVAGNTVFVIWHQSDNVLYRTSTDGGVTWSQTGTVSDTRIFGRDPSSISAASNQVVVLYGTSGGSIRAAFWNGSSFVNEQVAAGSGGDDFLANGTIAATSNGRAHALWRRVGGGIFYAERTASGTWTQQQLSPGVGSFIVSITADTQGNLYAFWAEYDNSARFTSKPVGGAWAAIQTFQGNGNFLANADGAVSSGFFHGVLEEWIAGVPNIRYYLIGTGGGGGGNPTEPPIGQCSQTQNEIRTRITETWGLPIPQPSAVDTAPGARGYTQLRNQIASGPGQRAAAKMLAGERYALSHGFPSVMTYLTTAWLWFENGSDYYPDPYEVNCENGNVTKNRVSYYCENNVFQVAGYQAAESRKNYNDTFTKLYGSSQLASVLQRVRDGSPDARLPQWRYSGNPDGNNGLMQYLSYSFNPQMSYLATNGSAINDLPRTQDRDIVQFISLMAGKDPAMIAALNNSPQGGVSMGDLINDFSNRSETHRQILSNMIYALWMLDCGQ